jgi:RAC serine/threonine-protein kinase
VLYSDGTFRGFKNKTPGGLGVTQDPLNNFKIDRTTKLLANDKIRKNGFIIRCLQMTTFVERNLCADTDTERYTHTHTRPEREERES